MPVIYSAYDTTFGRRYSTDSTKAAIAKATVSNYLTKNDEGVNTIEDTTDTPVDIPSFTHPMYLENSQVRGMYIDARSLVSRNRQTGEIKINSIADYNMLRARATLENIWRRESPMLFRSMSFPASVYAQWLAENIQKQFGLEPENQYKLTIFAAWFYYSQFSDDEAPNDNDYVKVCQLITKATGVPVAKVMEILDGQSYVKGIADFCARAEEVTGSVQLRGFSSIVIYPLLNQTWFSANSTEVVPVALEHIPTFLAMCQSAVTEHAYSRSRLSKMAERVPAKNASREFVLQMTATLRAE